MSAPDYAAMDHKALMRAEMAIARRFIGGMPWAVVVMALANVAVWLALWPLTLMGMLPLWAACLIATINGIVSYHPSHEAQHGNMGRRGSKTRWLNEVIGHVTTLPSVLPYKLLKVNHLQHHAHVNHPKKDPDWGWGAPNVWRAILHTFSTRQPGSPWGLNRYVTTLKELDTPEAREAMWQTNVASLLFLGFIIAMAWSGHALVAAAVWWLPRHIASTWIIVCLNWSPHHPNEEQGRYRHTRAYRSPLGMIASMGIEYHIVHHLHPAIPITRNPAAFRALLPILEARGCRIDGMPGKTISTTLIEKTL